jgi:hypothetical protein
MSTPTQIEASTQLKFNGNVNVNANSFIDMANPPGTSAGNLYSATQEYNDATFWGLSQKNTCFLATTTSLPAYTYSNGSSGAGATITFTATGTNTVDGTVTALNERILVKNETGGNAPNNGIYYVSTAGATGVAGVWTRVPDMSVALAPLTVAQEPAAFSLYSGAFTFIVSGTANTGTEWFCETLTPITVGTTNISFVQVNAGATYTASTGVVLVGNNFEGVVTSTGGLQVGSSGFAVLLNGSTLTTGASGLSVTNAGITDVQLAAFGPGTGITGGAGSPVTIQWSTNEIPSGALNGSNVTFTLAHTPMTGNVVLFLNGVEQGPGSGVDYTISGSTITYNIAPITTDVLRANYPY